MGRFWNTPENYTLTSQASQGVIFRGVPEPPLSMCVKGLRNGERRKKIYKFLVKRRLLTFITPVGLCFSQMF